MVALLADAFPEKGLAPSPGCLSLGLTICRFSIPAHPRFVSRTLLLERLEKQS
jgi:hypothetical protein